MQERGRHGADAGRVQGAVSRLPGSAQGFLKPRTIDALVDAFGRSSAEWQGHVLAVEIDKLPGKKFPFFLIPEGYKRVEDENGYAVIVKKSAEKASGEEDLSGIPF